MPLNYFDTYIISTNLLIKSNLTSPIIMSFGYFGFNQVKREANTQMIEVGASLIVVTN